jgi:hypothetical protein
MVSAQTVSPKSVDSWQWKLLLVFKLFVRFFSKAFANRFKKKEKKVLSENKKNIKIVQENLSHLMAKYAIM